MKTLAIMYVLVFGTFYSYSKTDESKLQQLVAEIDLVEENRNNYLELSIQFNEASTLDKSNWLPFYHSSYCKIIATFLPGQSDVDSILDQAEVLLKTADVLSPENSEIYALQGLLASARIMVDPQTRGMKYGQLCDSWLEKAILLDDKNPRPYFMKAQGLMYIPKEYGGGCENAKPLLLESKELFDKEIVISKTHPNWGLSEVNSLLEICNQ